MGSKVKVSLKTDNESHEQHKSDQQSKLLSVCILCWKSWQETSSSLSRFDAAVYQLAVLAVSM